jgi:CheY-like chemotaxis protein
MAAARILVVNDAQEILDAFRALLEGEGYEVITWGAAFRDADEVARLQPDVIILDYLFGAEKLGWQMLQLLKLNRATAAIPLIVCTAATREVRDIQADLLVKGVRLVHKPFDIDDLLDAVKDALEAGQSNAYLTIHDPERAAQPVEATDDLQRRRKQKPS